jgi:hypothetical protein
VTSSIGQMVRFRPTDRLDDVFDIGIVLKGIDGLLEVSASAIAGRPRRDRCSSQSSYPPLPAVTRAAAGGLDTRQ